MISKIAVTYQIDDATLAATELSRAVQEGTPLLSHTVGILMCYSDMDVPPLLRALSQHLPFDIIGCTCIASLDSETGFSEMAIRLLVLSADDCTFSVQLSGPVGPDTIPQRVEETYAGALDALGRPPGLLLMLAPYKLDLLFDTFTQTLNRVAPGVPVIGGLPSHNDNGDLNAVLFNETAYPDRMAMLAIAGNIHPVFSVQNVLGDVVRRKRKVANAAGNTVYRVGSQTFVEYMEEIGFHWPDDGMIDTLTFLTNPLMLENVPLDDGQTHGFVRTLHKIDKKEGSGTAVGMIPTGATLSICSLSKQDIEEAASKALAELMIKIADKRQNGQVFSTVLAVSCIGRFMLMSPRSSIETERLLAGLPPDVTLAGFYGYGEIGPVSRALPKIVNFAHNETLILCAF